MEPAPYTTAVLFLRISSISILPFALVGRRPHLRLSSPTRLADLSLSCQKQYTSVCKSSPPLLVSDFCSATTRWVRQGSGLFLNHALRSVLTFILPKQQTEIE